MNWLRENASGIQAIAAVVSAIVTVVLVRITARYVALTNDLVQNGRENLDFLQRERAVDIEVRRDRLHTLIQHLRALATALPSEPSRGESMRNATLWLDSDAQELRYLAVPFGRSAGDLGSEAARHLTVLAELVRGVQATPRGVGVEWNRFPWERWHVAFQGAKRCLQSLAGHIERDV